MIGKFLFTIAAIFFLSLSVQNTLAQEAYANLSEDSKTLSFYYDDLKATREGTIYGVKLGGAWNKINSPSVASRINTVVFDDSFKKYKPTTCKSWFYGLSLLTTIIDIQNLNTEDVTDMMFMFSDCERLETLDLSNFKTANVTNMSAMFQSCSKLKTLDLSNFNTENVTDMEFMFNDCSSLLKLDISSFSTESVTDISCMFQGCEKIQTLDLSSFNTSNVTDMKWVFNGCTRLKTIYVSDKWSTKAVEKAEEMFKNCKHLYGGNGTYCKESGLKYAHVDTKDNPGYFTLSGQPAFKVACPYATFDESTKTFTMGYGLNLPEGAVEIYDISIDESWIGCDIISSSEVKKIVVNKSFVDFKPVSCSNWFDGCTSLTEIEGISNINTENVTSMNSMFYKCQSLSSLDLSSFNTANVADMKNMFSFCSNLTSLDLAKFNTSNVTTMYSMFDECKNLTSLDLRSFNTQKVRNMQYMFSCCYKLSSLDLSSFNTEMVNDMGFMFFDCDKLTSLDLSSFVVDNCGLEAMFQGCSSLKTIYCSNTWTVSLDPLYERMFLNCTKLVGGNGTNYDVSKKKQVYACIDSDDAPGYFTLGTLNPTYAYAELSADKKTITFYHDNKQSERKGIITKLRTKTLSTADLESIEVAIFDESFKDYYPRSCNGWFENMKNLTTITNLNYLNTDEVYNMSKMFYGCSSLTELDLSSFKVGDSYYNIGNMFSGCSNLTTIYVSSFWEINGSSVSGTFEGCEKLVGGQGFAYDPSCTSSGYARINTQKKNGYFTLKGTIELIPNLSKIPLSKIYDGSVDIPIQSVPDKDYFIYDADVSINVVSAKYESASVSNINKITITLELNGADKDYFTLPQKEYELEGFIKPMQLIPCYKLRFHTYDDNYGGEIALDNLVSGDDVHTKITFFEYGVNENGDSIATVKFELDGKDAANYYLTETEKVIALTSTPVASVEKQSSDITIYPNPATAHQPINIEISNSEPNGTLYIYNANGMLVNTIATVSKSTQIFLPSGYYFGVYVDKNSKKSFKLVVK